MAHLRVPTSLGYLATYVVAMVVGMGTVQSGTGLAFFWPATGVAALWLLRGRNRDQVLLDAALLLAATVTVDLVHDLTPVAAVLYGLANLLMAVTVRLSSARFEFLSFWERLPRRVAGKSDVRALGLSSFAGAVVSLPIALAATYVQTDSFIRGFGLAWVARNTCSTFVVVASVLAILTTLFRSHAHRGWAARLASESRPHWQLELVVAASISLGATGVLFGSTRQLPIAFMLLLVATWIGYRFSPAVGGSYAIILSVVTVLCTEAGRGPFGAMVDPTARAVVVQIYALATTVMVLFVSLGVAERSALLARVVDSEARATSRAELLDAVMNLTPDGLAVVESTGKLVMLNPAGQVLAGRDGPARINDQGDPDFYQPDGSLLAPEDVPSVRALRGEVVTAEDMVRIDPGTGSQTILSVSAAPLDRPEAQGGRLAVVSIHDVTTERAHRRELQAFAGTVAHDLKTPLTGIGSWAEILGDQLDALGCDVAQARTSLRRIESSANRMEQLISDLLAYSQAQSATLAAVPLSLTGMVEAVARELRETNDVIPPVIDFKPLGRVLADRVLVRQLLSNVMGNAVKYVAPGDQPHIVVSSKTVGDMLEVRVADNGIGIPRAERGRIFDSFYRASSSGDYPGTGLGLAICARAVERHGGRISARGGLDGRGTTVVFTLPLDCDPLVFPTQDEIDADQRAGETTSAEPPPRRVGSDTAVS
jgi:signal transduction histidine kinase